MAGGEPRLGTTATYMRHNDHGTTLLSTEIDILHDLINNEYRVFSAGSVSKWSKFGLGEIQVRLSAGGNEIRTLGPPCDGRRFRTAGTSADRGFRAGRHGGGVAARHQGGLAAPSTRISVKDS